MLNYETIQLLISDAVPISPKSYGVYRGGDVQALNLLKFYNITLPDPLPPITCYTFCMAAHVANFSVDGVSVLPYYAKCWDGANFKNGEEIVLNGIGSVQSPSSILSPERNIGPDILTTLRNCARMPLFDRYTNCSRIFRPEKSSQYLSSP